jgi:hypothetical protein
MGFGENPVEMLKPKEAIKPETRRYVVSKDLGKDVSYHFTISPQGADERKVSMATSYENDFRDEMPSEPVEKVMAAAEVEGYIKSKLPEGAVRK